VNAPFEQEAEAKALKHAGMQEFILFELSLILSKDARSQRPYAGLAPATRALITEPASSVVIASKSGAEAISQWGHKLSKPITA